MQKYASHLHSFFLIKILLIDLFLFASLYGQNPDQSVIDVNNITSWIGSNGFHPTVVKEGGISGSAWNGTFPKGTAGAIYTEGVVWGGKVFDGNSPLVRVSGSTYFNRNFPLTRLYRVRTFYDQVDLRDDAANTLLVSDSTVTDSMISKVYDQYKKDWNEWPADKGAPFNDINKDGRYEPNIDIPGVPGASQTIWISYDDRNSVSAYGSPPIGLEVQETYWAYANDSTLANVIYKRVRIIYRGLTSPSPGSHIDSMYVTEFSDPDDGQYTDDFLGCDTLLNLGYVYNSNDSDALYKKFSLAPPAVGYSFLHGAAEKTSNTSDSAIVDFKWRKGYKFFNTKPMSVFIALRTSDYIFIGNPFFGNYSGSLHYYNLMRGYLSDYPGGGPITYKGQPVKYMLSGDPVKQSGWYDGIETPAGTRRMDLVSGPFNLKLGDTAEVTMALIGGLGTNHLTSISYLRYYTRYAISSFNYFVQQMTEGQEISAAPPIQKTKTLPEHYILYQNYPNPFNPTTTIKYEMPEAAYVKLIVYDILGREVKILVDEQKDAGSYKVNFDGSNLPSGVYFYRITFTNSDSKLVNDKLSKVNKLMLIK